MAGVITVDCEMKGGWGYNGRLREKVAEVITVDCKN